MKSSDAMLHGNLQGAAQVTVNAASNSIRAELIKLELFMVYRLLYLHRLPHLAKLRNMV